MTKVLMLFLVLVVGFLFYPFRDLYVRDDPFAENYTLVEKGFWTLGDCVDAAKARRANDYLCRKRSGFASLSGTYTRYGGTQGD